MKPFQGFDTGSNPVPSTGGEEPKATVPPVQRRAQRGADPLRRRANARRSGGSRHRAREQAKRANFASMQRGRRPSGPQERERSERFRGVGSADGGNMPASHAQTPKPSDPLRTAWNPSASTSGPTWSAPGVALACIACVASPAKPTFPSRSCIMPSNWTRVERPRVQRGTRLPKSTVPPMWMACSRTRPAPRRPKV